MLKWLHRAIGRFTTRLQPPARALQPADAAGPACAADSARAAGPVAAAGAGAGAGLDAGGAQAWPVGWRFVGWLLDGAAASPGEPGAREQRLLQRLDGLIESAAGHERLLPRAASVVPQLLACLRDADLALSALSEQVARDVTLVAEVIRLANSAGYRGAAPVTQLDAALRTIGASGLRQAIARVVVRPLFEARAGELAARSASRLWQHTEAKAQRCAALARQARLDPFEGYLLGLVHNASWTVVLREMDREGSGRWQLGPDFVQALLARRDRLFGVIGLQWRLTEGLAEAAAEVLRHGSIEAASARCRLLAQGDAQAGAFVLGLELEGAGAGGEAVAAV